MISIPLIYKNLCQLRVLNPHKILQFEENKTRNREKATPAEKNTYHRGYAQANLQSVDRLELERPQCPLGAVGQVERVP